MKFNMYSYDIKESLHLSGPRRV